jgi:hypothetical protein
VNAFVQTHSLQRNRLMAVWSDDIR